MGFFDINIFIAFIGGFHFLCAVLRFVFHLIYTAPLLLRRGFQRHAAAAAAKRAELEARGQRKGGKQDNVDGEAGVEDEGGGSSSGGGEGDAFAVSGASDAALEGVELQYSLRDNVTGHAVTESSDRSLGRCRKFLLGTRLLLGDTIAVYYAAYGTWCWCVCDNLCTSALTDSRCCLFHSCL